jgi:NDP-sugar pyrophosphorylase family protein
MSKLQGLIPAAGKGVRARPYTHQTHKGMLDINGTPNIQRIIEIMRDQLAITEIVIVIGYLGDTIKSHFGSGESLGVAIEYIENDELDKGLAWSIYLAHQKITADYFCVMLCDECYINSNHAELLQSNYEASLVTCCGMPVEDKTLIQRNFAIFLQTGNSIAYLHEKPEIVPSRIMGTGTFLLQRPIFDHLKSAFDSSPDGFVDFVSNLNHIHQETPSLRYFEIKGTYVNINDRDSLYLAKYHERKRHFPNCSRALIIYSEGREENIGFTIQQYSELGIFQKISVVLPYENTISEIVRASGAGIIVCPENLRLYGEKLKHAMEMTSEDIIVLAEADYSFPSRDVEKLLTYLPEVDMVIGTRTTRQLIEQGSTMKGHVRLANAFLGRLLELLWWNRQGRFTDVGCTFRAVWNNSFSSVQHSLNSRGPEFSAEMLIAMLDQHQRVIEIPVNYFNRSLSIQSEYQTTSTFFRFLWLILTRRLSKPISKQKA